MAQSILYGAIASSAKVLTVSQVMLFLPLTLSALSPPAFLLLSLLQTAHSVIHSTLHLVTPILSPALPFLQLPVHPVLLLLSFNLFSAPPHWLVTLSVLWGKLLRFWTPGFVGMEGLASVLVIQTAGRVGRDMAETSETWQFILLVASASAYVVSSFWIYVTYPAIAITPLSSTLFGVALTALIFLTLIGFAQRRTNVIESAGMLLYFAYNVWLCADDDEDGGYGTETYYAKWLLDSSTAVVYAPLISNLVPHLSKLLSFIRHTLPKSLLASLFYRLTILQIASTILPKIGGDGWESEDGVASGGWETRPSAQLTKVLLAYRQTIFVTVYSHLLLLDHSSQVWWRWANVFFTLFTWAVELLLTNEEDELVGGSGGSSKLWKTD